MAVFAFAVLGVAPGGEVSAEGDDRCEIEEQLCYEAFPSDQGVLVPGAFEPRVWIILAPNNRVIEEER